MIRQFSLKNEYGQTYSLNDPATGFLQNPTGLGNLKESSFVAIGSAWMVNFIRNAQATINGELLFKGPHPYDAYAAFTAFIRQSSELSLEYTTSYGTYYKDVVLVSLEKTEITEGNVLLCPVSFAATSLWYASQSDNLSLSDGSVLALPFTPPARFNDNTAGNVAVPNNGSEAAPFRVTMYGPITQPSIILLADGEELYRADIDYSALSGEKICYSSVDNDLYVYHENASGVQTNLFPHMDIENANFFKIPVGGATLQITAGATITAPVVVSIYNLYGAV